MEYLISILKASHFLVFFSFHNPDTNLEAAYVPKPLEPLGYYIAVEVFDRDSVQVYQTYRPKVKPKLDPSRAESYIALEPGYTYGISLELEGFDPKPGIYQIAITYSSQQFQGFDGHPLGEILHREVVSLEVK